MPPIRPQKRSKTISKQVNGKPSRSAVSAKPQNASFSENKSGKAVSLRDLKWSGVALPAMALSAGPSSAKGTRDEEDETEGLEWDPFAELDEGADDFMGLQEVSGVGVKFQGDDQTGRRIQFYQSDPTEKDDKVKEKSIKTSAKIDKKGKGKAKAKESLQDSIPIAEEGLKRSDALQGEEQEAENLQEAAGTDGYADEEEEEFAGFSDDDPDSEEELSRPQPEEQHKRTGDEQIPQGIFSMLEADDEQDLDVSTQTYADATFNDADLPKWPRKVLKTLHPILKNALLNLKFTTPTKVQSASLPKILPPASVGSSEAGAVPCARDVVALAQTGSGKTLAYALPILQKILASRTSIYSQEERPLQALIILPTRELAMQVNEVFQNIVAASTSDSTRWVRIAPVVGGMSEERQWRLLKGRAAKGADPQSTGKDAEIIIATVGRLWELCKSDDYLPNRLAGAETLVLDEADRLLETGKFQELASVLDLLQNPDRQTLMFSATLDPTLQVNLSKSRAKVARAMKRSKDQDKMARLMDKVGFRDPEGACLVDLTQQAMLSDSLKEGKVECLETEKDLYLYYLLLRYPGSTLVFFNSIDSVRRIQPLLATLQMDTFPLHGEMDQKSRLKSLDKFKKSIPNAGNKDKATVLLATDVAARGLDIPSVEHVIHFHLPRSTDTYIHRSGRTARAGLSGLSIILLSPNEKNLWTSIRKNLQKQGDLSNLEITFSILGRLKKRISLAKEIDSKKHKERKETVEDNWMKNLAEEADILLDEDEVDPDLDHHVGKQNKKANSKAAADIRRLQEELHSELHKSLLIRGSIKRKYITQGIGLSLGGGNDIDGNGLDKEVLNGIINGTGHNTFLGLQKSKAQDDLDNHQKNKNQKTKKQKKGLVNA
ncbi:unnamed protein product [Sympodiomycopsis kandeliae]